MLKLTFAVITKTLFGKGIEESLDEFLQDFDCVVQLTQRSRIPFLDHLLIGLPLPSNIRFKRAIGNLNAKIRGLIDEHRSQGAKGEDILSMLLRAQNSPEGAEQLSDQQIHDEMMTLLLAGHETISNALTWMWYLLDRHEEVEAKLHEELQSVLGGRNPTSEDLPRLPYGRMVLLETMRLYPPVWVVTRRPTEDTEIGGYHVPAWASLNMCPFLMHRDARYFPDPERFDPERWLPEEVARRPRFSYFPFGGGPHQCIGEPLAMTEGQLITATIAQRWRLRRIDHSEVAPEPLITLRPEHPIVMRPEKRTPQNSPGAAV
jgi:cytochrome P450